MIKKWPLLLLWLFFSCTIEPQQPNIILFLVDDLGWQDTSVPFWSEKTRFNRRYHTPNMERLAAQGMKFTQAYATSVCSPTRVSLMTGMNAARHRVTNWTLHKDALKSMEINHPDLIFPKWNMNGLSPDSTTANAVFATPLPKLLRQAGYLTILAGKAHLGAIGTPGENPLNLGFDINIAGHAAGAPGSYYGTENFGNQPDGTSRNVWSVPGLSEYHGQEINLTEALTQKAIRAMDRAVTAKQPFFLYLSHYTVHTPVMADRRFYQKYLESGLDSVEARYASMVEGMDKSLGDLMDYLEDNNLEDHTTILFMSDNGGLSAVARGGEKHTHNQPLSSGKGSAHEGGIREPMLVKWPGVVKAGSISHDYLIIEDFFPTILDIAGIHNPYTAQQVDGKSFLPMLRQKGSTASGRALYWHFPNEWGPTGPGIGASSTIRKDNWKLIYYHRDQRFELFDLEADIGERQNLAGKAPEKLKELALELATFLKSVDAQMPADRKTGQAIPYPLQ